ncbi:phage tail protein [Janthinobacterium sp. BJB412]|nr:phage tail protein [Janthinobacterium sp. BJB412]
MSFPYIGEIRMFCGNFAPAGWALCDGAMLAIAENDVLFNLIGTTYGGDGQQTFALPDLRGRVPLHRGQLGGDNYVPGQLGGSEGVTLSTLQLPAHNHLVGASAAAPPPAVAAINVSAGVAYVPASPAPKPRLYGAPGSPAAMAPGAIGNSGGNQPHNNMAPFLAVNFIISLFGVFPSPN